MVWEVASVVIDNRIILVSPRITFARLFQLSGTRVFWESVGQSLGRIMYGFSLALGAGVIFATVSARSRVVYRLVLPAINVMNAIPIASFTLLALMAVQRVNLPVFIAFVTVLPIIFLNTYKGIESTDPQLLEMANVFKVPPWKRAVYIYFKTVAPYVVSAASVGIGFAWKSGISAELIGMVRGTIGFSLNDARNFLLTADLLAWTVAIVILSYAMEKAFRLLFGRILKWQSN